MSDRHLAAGGRTWESIATAMRARGLDPDSVPRLREVKPEEVAWCALCDAPFLTVRAVIITSLSGRRHVAHADCAGIELEQKRRKPRIQMFVVGIDSEEDSRT